MPGLTIEQMPKDEGVKALSHVSKEFRIGPILFRVISCLAGTMGDFSDSGLESCKFQFIGPRNFAQIVRGYLVSREIGSQIAD
jgi:hypothetical protein